MVCGNFQFDGSSWYCGRHSISGITSYCARREKERDWSTRGSIWKCHCTGRRNDWVWASLQWRGTVPFYNTAQLHHTTPYHITPHDTTPHYTTPHHTRPHHITPHYTTRHHTLPHHITQQHTTPYTIPYHTIPYHTISYHIISYHTIPYNTMPYHTIPPVLYISLQVYRLCFNIWQISEKVELLLTERERLHDGWTECQTQYDQMYELAVFMKEAKQIETIMSSQEVWFQALRCVNPVWR